VKIFGAGRETENNQSLKGNTTHINHRGPFAVQLLRFEIFYAPISKDRGQIVFGLFVRPYVCKKRPFNIGLG
jgi:hypothetical protein